MLQRICHLVADTPSRGQEGRKKLQAGSSCKGPGRASAARMVLERKGQVDTDRSRHRCRHGRARGPRRPAAGCSRVPGCFKSRLDSKSPPPVQLGPVLCCDCAQATSRASRQRPITTAGSDNGGAGGVARPPAYSQRTTEVCPVNIPAFLRVKLFSLDGHSYRGDQGRDSSGRSMGLTKSMVRRALVVLGERFQASCSTDGSKT